MPGERLRQVVRGVLAVGDLDRDVVVVLEHRTVVRVGHLDHLGDALTRRLAAQVGDAVLGDDQVGVVLGVVDVRHHRDNRRDGAPLGGRRADEDGQAGVAGEVARAADAVLHPRAHDVGRVHVAVHVGLDHAVHGDDAESADDLGVVRDLLVTQDDLLAVELGVVVHLRRVLRRQRERGGRGDLELAGVDQVDHAVLDHLGVGGQVLELAVQQAGEDRVGDVADAGLHRWHRVGQAPGLRLEIQEVEQVAGDRLGDVVERLERRVAVRGVVLDDRDHLGRVDGQVLAADPVTGVVDRDGEVERDLVQAAHDVVHALEVLGLPGVHLEDDLVGQIEPGLVVADRGGRDERAVGLDGAQLDDGEVHLAVEPVAELRRDVREVDIRVLDLTGVDLLAGLRIGLVRRPEVHRAGVGQLAVQLGSGRGAGAEADPERLARGVQRLGAGGKSDRHRLRVAGAGEAGDPDHVSVIDQRGGVLSAHHLALVRGVVDPIAHECPPSQARLCSPNLLVGILPDCLGRTKRCGCVLCHTVPRAGTGHARSPGPRTVAGPSPGPAVCRGVDRGARWSDPAAR
ncbi:hypothetical protein SDC9_67596 [bioreactor metagenome]|uniref:NAD-specific glutamate dehydrogenase n=1 Tax=bioreactor metagenome TaxID=1076179 RepID=A0A644Y3Q1_9ZZZZ